MADIKLQPGDRVSYKLQLGDHIPEGKHVGQYIRGVVIRNEGETVSVQWRHDQDNVQERVDPLDLELE